MMEDNIKTNVGIYVRVSTEEQAKEGYSVRAQIEKLSDYARIMGWNIYKIYADEGISGKNISERPAINAMIQDIKDKKINSVLVFKVDRLTRSIRDLVELVEIFNTSDCTFVSLLESIDTKTASGRMFLKIIGIFAEFERENIMERTRLGLERKAREGYALSTGNSSYGYNLPVGEKIQIINEEEAKIVREVFHSYVYANKSFTRIASDLNIRKVPTKKGSNWDGRTIKKLLTNPNYIGNVRYSLNDKSRYFEVKGHHEAIISQELYDKAQLKISKIEKKSFTKRPREDTFFSGTLYCSVCGRKLSSRQNYKMLKNGSKSTNTGYRCVGKSVKMCTAKEMSQFKVEEAFLEYINIIENIKIPKDFEVEQNDVTLEAVLSIQEYENKLQQFEKKEKEIMTLYLTNQIDFDEYTKMTKIITNEIRNLENILISLEEESEKEHTVLDINDIITNIKDNWQLLTNSEKMEFIHNYIDRIYVENETVENKIYGKVKIKKIEFFKE